MGPQALWQQIAADIAADIDSGQLGHHAQLPPRGELCRRYQVSAVTVHRAIAELHDQGRVLPVQGRGTFAVARNPRDETAADARST